MEMLLKWVFCLRCSYEEERGRKEEEFVSKNDFVLHWPLTNQQLPLGPLILQTFFC